MPTYLKDEATGKVYTHETLQSVSAVDPYSFDTDLQNLNNELNVLYSQVVAKQKEISAKQKEKIDFFEAFPEIKAEIYPNTPQ